MRRGLAERIAPAGDENGARWSIPRRDDTDALATASQRGYLRAVRETDEEIREIKTEIIESRGLTIKTNNLVNSLGADIKSIAKRQAGYERRFNWNGAVAYVLFAALSFGGLKLASDATIASIEREKSTLESRNNDLRRALLEERQRADDRSAAEARAARFYDLIRQQKRREVVTRYQAIAEDTHISRAEAQFFRDMYEQFRLDLSIEAYQNALDMIRTGRYAEAADKLQEAIRLKEDAAHVPSMKYELARALRRLGRQSEALIHAREVAEQETDPDLQDDAWFLIALCHEELDALDDAIDAYLTLIRRWPRSSNAREARPMLRDVRIRRLRRD